MLEGKTINLKVLEKNDLPLIGGWINDVEFFGQYFSPMQLSKTEVEKMFEPGPHELKAFVIEKKDGTIIGEIGHFYALHPMWKTLEIGYSIIPSERGKGYCTEAAQVMVDYLFLSKDAACIQATTHCENVASQKVLQKVGFKREGTMRKRANIRGEWRDITLFSILREEWKEPKILTKTV